MDATLRNMREHAAEPGLVAWSPETGEQCSADYRNYWYLAEDDALTDEYGEPMILARWHSNLEAL